MDALELLKERRSCRSYEERMVPEELIEKVTEAGLYAPTARGCQNGIILAITNKELRDKTSKLNAEIMGAPIDPFYGAPVILLVASKKGRIAECDGACMIENMMIEATSLGLGSCFIFRAAEELESDLYKEVFQSLGLDAAEYQGIGHVALGYPKDAEYPPKEIKENRVFWIK